MQSLGKCKEFIRKGAEWWRRGRDLQKLYWTKTPDRIGLHKSGFVGDHSHSERRFEMLDTSAVVRCTTRRSFTWSSQLAAGSSYVVATKPNSSCHWRVSWINFFSLDSLSKCTSLPVNYQFYWWFTWRLEIEAARLYQTVCKVAGHRDAANGYRIPVKIPETLSEHVQLG